MIATAIANISPRNAVLGLAQSVRYAASPAFALMAALAQVYGGTDPMCSAMAPTSPVNGMVAMYVLMSVFHVAPWLRLLAGRSGADC
jgi:hypothetical protein